MIFFSFSLIVYSREDRFSIAGPERIFRPGCNVIRDMDRPARLPSADRCYTQGDCSVREKDPDVLSPAKHNTVPEK